MLWALRALLLHLLPTWPGSAPQLGCAGSLAQRELTAFEWMTSFRPDPVIRLNVDLDTAFARKPDHSPAALKRTLEIIPQLPLNGANIVEIDTAQPLEDVVAAGGLPVGASVID